MNKGGILYKALGVDLAVWSVETLKMNDSGNFSATFLGLIPIYNTLLESKD